MNKKKVFSIVFVLTLVLASALPLVNASTKKSNARENFGRIIFDYPSLLKASGYTEGLKNISSEFITTQMRSLNTQSQRDENGNWHITFSKPSSTEQKALEITQFPNRESLDFEEGIACIVVAIWDYPGTEYDLGWYFEDAYDDIMDHVNGVNSPYSYTNSLTNSGATYYYVNAWITWACAAYESVDIYLLGHGTEMWWGPPYYPPPWDYKGGYACYDTFTPYGIDSSKIYWEWDMQSFYEDDYDFSSLRMGMGSCCYGGRFANTFLNPGGAVSHDRTFMGPEGTTYNNYAWDFINNWDYEWYTVGLDSYTSFGYALDAAEDLLSDGYPFTYYGDIIYA